MDTCSSSSVHVSTFSLESQGYANFLKGLFEHLVWESSWQAKICVWASPICWFNDSSNWEQKQSLVHVLLCCNGNFDDNQETHPEMEGYTLFDWLLCFIQNMILYSSKWRAVCVKGKNLTEATGFTKCKRPLNFSSEMKWSMFWATWSPITLEIRGVVWWIELKELLGFMKEPIKNRQFSGQLFDVFECFENRGYTRIGYLIIYFHGYLSEPSIWMLVMTAIIRLW